jgi:L-ascorbate metabolism protein UlaG (beta-lactamase superfamily)
LRWGLLDRVLGRRKPAPAGPPAVRAAPRLDLVREPRARVALTWIGHGSFLGALGGAAFLVDPVFSQRVGWVVRRHVPPGLEARDLPPLDVLLVTHSHYDHLDGPSVRSLPGDVPVVVPLGLGRWFRRRGFAHATELDWWESTTAGRLSITLVPARHWSRRGVGDTNRTLWGGFVVERDGRRVYHAGDSAWFDGFAEIGRRFPGLSAALLPIGSYTPAWFMEPYHMNPEQAGRAFVALGARRLIPMHWGTFQLADEPLREPLQRLRRWWDEHGPTDGRELHVPDVGTTLEFED